MTPVPTAVPVCWKKPLSCTTWAWMRTTDLRVAATTASTSIESWASLAATVDAFTEGVVARSTITLVSWPANRAPTHPPPMPATARATVAAATAVGRTPRFRTAGWTTADDEAVLSAAPVGGAPGAVESHHGVGCVVSARLPSSNIANAPVGGRFRSASRMRGAARPRRTVSLETAEKRGRSGERPESPPYTRPDDEHGRTGSAQ